MINLTDKESPFFQANIKILSTIAYQLSTDLELFSGWCNAYGFEIYYTTEDGISFQLEKAQQSHQDPLIPRNASDVYFVQISLKIPINGRLTSKRKFLRTLFFKTYNGCSIGNLYYKNMEIQNVKAFCQIIQQVKDVSVKNKVLRIKTRLIPSNFAPLLNELQKLKTNICNE